MKCNKHFRYVAQSGGIVSASIFIDVDHLHITKRYKVLPNISISEGDENGLAESIRASLASNKHNVSQRL